MKHGPADGGRRFRQRLPHNRLSGKHRRAASCGEDGTIWNRMEASKMGILFRVKCVMSNIQYGTYSICTTKVFDTVSLFPVWCSNPIVVTWVCQRDASDSQGQSCHVSATWLRLGPAPRHRCSLWTWADGLRKGSTKKQQDFWVILGPSSFLKNWITLW